MKYTIIDKKDSLPNKGNNEIYIGITGSRSIEKNEEKYQISYKLLENMINKIIEKYPDKKVSLVSGGAKGIDKIAEEIANELKLDIYVIRPNYKEYFPKRAPLERNKTIANLSDILIAIKDSNSRSTGTMHCLNYFRKTYPNRNYIFKEI